MVQGVWDSKNTSEREGEKKSHYNERVTIIENGTFTTPLVFSTSGGMGGRECKTFYKRLCKMMAEKRGETSQRMTESVII